MLNVKTLKERKIKMYNVDMLKVLINAGVKVKPEQASEEDWAAAMASFSQQETTQPIQVIDVPAVQSIVPTQVVAQTPVVPVSQQPNQTFVGKKEYTFDDFKPQGMAVDGILTLKNGTPFVSQKEILKKAFKATLLFDETKVKQVIKCNVNGKATYFSTYGDGVDSRDGTPFQTKIDYCKRMDPNAFVYPSAELVFELDEDVTDPNGKVVATKGMKLGHSTSATNRKVLNEFYDACKMKGVDVRADHVPVQVGFVQMNNNKGQIWTCITLELVEG